MSVRRILASDGGTDGHAARVAERIARTLGGRGFEARLEERPAAAWDEREG